MYIPKKFCGEPKKIDKTVSPIRQDDLFLDLPRFKEVSEIPCAHDHPTNNPIHGKRPPANVPV